MLVIPATNFYISSHFIVLFCFLFSSSQAQKFDFGATAGINFAKLTGSDLGTKEKFNNLDSRTSFHLGVVSEVLIGGNFFLGPELLYSSQGAKEDDSELILNYIQIPLMGRYYFTEGFNAEIGPQLGILVNSSGEVNDVRITSDNFASTDISFAFGLGYKMTNGIFVRGRYFLGTNVAKSRESYLTGDEIIDYEYFNKVTQVSVGYMF